MLRVDVHGANDHPGLAPDEIVDLREQTGVLEDLAAVVPVDASLSGETEMEHVHAATVTENLLPLLGVKPVLGRNLSVQFESWSHSVAQQVHRWAVGAGEL